MSETPKRWTQTRVWLPPINGEYPRQKAMDDEELWISAAALRELVERWLTESTDPDWPKQAREAWVDCANELEKLLEDE